MQVSASAHPIWTFGGTIAPACYEDAAGLASPCHSDGVTAEAVWHRLPTPGSTRTLVEHVMGDSKSLTYARHVHVNAMSAETVRLLSSPPSLSHGSGLRSAYTLSCKVHCHRDKGATLIKRARVRRPSLERSQVLEQQSTAPSRPSPVLPLRASSSPTLGHRQETRLSAAVCHRPSLRSPGCDWSLP